MRKLHEKQELILSILKNHPEQLSLRDIQSLIGVSSPSVVLHHVQQLEKKGYIKRNPNNPQDYQILDIQEKENYVNLPVFTTAQCGIKGLLSRTEPIDRIPVPVKWIDFPSSKAFLVQARGKSMEPKIKPGDYVVGKATEAKWAYQEFNGKIIVGVHEGDPVIKKLYYDDKKNEVVLQSLNPDYPPFIASKDFWIEGEVRGIFSYSN